MGKHAAYDTDIVAWADEQAALLRDASRHSSLASNRIDWENIAEEIETVGRSETRAVTSAIRLVFVHLIKLAALPASPSSTHWRAEIVTRLGDIREDYTPSMAGKIDCQSLWQRAFKEASIALSDNTVARIHDLTQFCPFKLDDLLDEHINLADAVDTLTAKDNLA